MKHWYTFIPIPLSIAIFTIIVVLLYHAGFFHIGQFIW